jgi:hypothetical protein
MSRLSILSNDEITEFDYPPPIPSDTKTLYFRLTKELENKLNMLRTPTNKVGFLLQYGYFKSCKRFFVVSKFRKEDIEYVATTLGIPLRTVNFSQYKKKTPIDHQAIILKLLDYRPFNEIACQWVKSEITQQIRHFADPKEVFIGILHLLHDQRIEIPSYHRLSELISRDYVTYEDRLIKIVGEQISPSNREALNALLNAKQERIRGTLNSFTVINQSTKPKAIQASLNIFNQVGALFIKLLPTIVALDLTSQSCSYYATWIAKSKLSQIKQLADKNKMYLYLISFIQHQFYLRQDTCVDIFLKCVQSAKNTATKRLDESDKLTKGERRAAVKHLSASNRNCSNLITEIAKIAHSPVLTDRGKIKEITALLYEHEKQKFEVTQEKVTLFEKSLDRIADDKDYFDALEKTSLKLQYRVTGITRALIFNEASSNKDLITAINHFKNKDGQIDCKAPCEFMKEDEHKALIGDNGLFRTSLYKVLLFVHIANGIRSGDLNLKHSYRYLSIQEYLIDKEV